MSKPPTHEPNALRNLAQSYLRAANEAPAEHRFGDRKVFLCSVADLTDSEACTQLLELHMGGYLKLARADLVAAMDPELVATSELDAHGAVFHFLCTR